MTSGDLVLRILQAAVDDIGGQPRPGQVEMATAVAQTFDGAEPLLVQAGTGTGKSLGYLAPALAHIAENPESVAVVATATLALQTQLAEKDVPTVLAAVKKVTGKTLSAAVLKGRSNYACLWRVRDQQGTEPEALLGGEELVSALRSVDAAPDSVLGAEVVSLREWAEAQAASHGSGERDAAPSHSGAAWAQVSVPIRECLGQSCRYVVECFAEASRAKARESDLIITNHALLAVDAMHGGTALPEHDLLVVDEAHELVARITGAATDELSPQIIERAGRRSVSWLDDEVALELLESADGLRIALGEAQVGRLTDPDDPVTSALVRVRTAARAAITGMQQQSGTDSARSQAQGAVQEIFDVAARMAGLKPVDVVWVAERERYGRRLLVAPLDVSGLIRNQVLADTQAVFTSATLTIGGQFGPTAVGLGLSSDGDWRGIDVGSPFDYPKQGIVYIGKDLPPPGREGLNDQTLAQIQQLVQAANGRTLGLFASHRNAAAAAEYLREHAPDLTVLCQGEAHLTELTRRFVDEPDTSLFGTLSLWQGLDVPGDSCQLVLIDKIPFPRPDEPLLLARQQAVTARGGNGFLQVAASHAGLLLAQGAGRLIRGTADKGVVAILDSRLITAGYGGFLRASMPPLWTTTDVSVAVAALERLARERHRRDDASAVALVSDEQ